MNNPTAILKSLIVYAICIPLAIFVGYLLTKPLSYESLGMAGILALAMSFPLLIRWHYPLMLLSWNATIVLFFVKGAPKLWLAAVALSLGISVMEHILNRDRRFIRVPQITLPLICMIGVILVTAKLTGGFGLRMLGSEVYGGKKYIVTLVGILSYFALTARVIPREKAPLAIGLMFLGGITAFIGDFFYLAPSLPHFIFWIFPPGLNYGGFDLESRRLPGASTLSSAVIFFMLARYGIRGVFLSGKWWRLIAFFGVLAIGLLGGYRSMLISIAIVFSIQFFLEGIHRTKLLPIFVLAGVLIGAMLFPITPKLPFSVQRTLSVVPLLPVDKQAKYDAQATWEWRLDMWKSLMPQIPTYFWLGKGFSFDQQDFLMMGDTAFKAIDASQQSLALSNDYHNGWISVLITFGVWGMAVLLWFMAAGLWALYRNYRYGDPDLRIVNSFLFAHFIMQTAFFLTVGGGGLPDMPVFIGTLGFGIALNGGVCKETKTSQPQTSSPFSSLHRGRLLPSRSPVFQR